MDSGTLRCTAGACTAFLSSQLSADWTVHVPVMRASVAEVVTHIAQTFVWYPFDLAAATVRRLFPWAPADCAPWQALLWANGRISLPDLPRPERWRWHCAPLSEWDGESPVP